MYKFLNIDGYEKIIKKCNLSSLAAKAMQAYNLSFTNKLTLNNPYDYYKMDKVVGLILHSLNNNEKVMIYGDYDVDGICAASILVRTFKIMGHDVGYYIPNRYKDGYGLASNIVESIYKKDYKLLICVDNGIKAFDSIKLAKEYGLNVIVLDHHQKEESFPLFDYLLHPIYSNYSNYNMCGASIANMLSIALLGREDEICIALAGIATVGDVMPIVEQNKLLVKKSLDILNEGKYKAINLLNKDNKKYDEMSLAMQIVPKLNSVGRMCNNNSSNNIVKFLSSDEENELQPLANFIDKTNSERRLKTESFFMKLDKGTYNENIIIEKDDQMLEGINGIVAAKFLNKYNKPAIVFSLDDKQEFYKGSARSTESCDILDLLKKNPYIEVYGGHKAAAGLSVKKELFKQFLEQIVIDCKEIEYKEKVLEVIEISENELSFKAYKDLLKFSPFGEQNPNPLFILRNISKNRINLSKDKKHILVTFNNEVSLVGFNLGYLLKKDINNYDFIIKLEENNLYINKVSCKCIKMEEACYV